jgi:hypothetical protein
MFAPCISGDRRVIAFDYLQPSAEIKTLSDDASDRLRH